MFDFNPLNNTQAQFSLSLSNEIKQFQVPVFMEYFVQLSVCNCMSHIAFSGEPGCLCVILLGWSMTTQTHFVGIIV